MRRPKLLQGFLVLLTVPWACAGEPTSSGGTPIVVTDTLGLRFDLDCSSGRCVLMAENSSVAPVSCAIGSGTDAFLLSPNSLLSIYAMHVAASGEVAINAADPSHPVACATDADCLAPGISLGSALRSYTCQYGLCLLHETCSNDTCTPWDKVLLTYDVLTLCQADLPWPTSCPYLTSQPLAGRIAAVADACGSNTTCATIPPACRQLAGPGIDGGA